MCSLYFCSLFFFSFSHLFFSEPGGGVRVLCLLVTTSRPPFPLSSSHKPLSLTVVTLQPPGHPSLITEDFGSGGKLSPPSGLYLITLTSFSWGRLPRTLVSQLSDASSVSSVSVFCFLVTSGLCTTFEMWISNIPSMRTTSILLGHLPELSQFCLSGNSDQLSLPLSSYLSASSGFISFLVHQ